LIVKLYIIIGFGQGFSWLVITALCCGLYSASNGTIISIFKHVFKDIWVARLTTFQVNATANWSWFPRLLAWDRVPTFRGD